MARNVTLDLLTSSVSLKFVLGISIRIVLKVSSDVFYILGLINEYSQACPTNSARHCSRYSFKNSFLQQFPRVQHNSRIIFLNISLYIHLDIPPRFPSVNSSEIPLEMFSGISSRIFPWIVSDILWQCPTDFSPEIDSEDPLGIPPRIFKRFFQEWLY